MRLFVCCASFLGLLGGCSDDSLPTDPDPVVTPSDADPDQDYLTDAEEAARGTDPNNPDTDADRYLDGDEVLEGTDPLDAASRIYQGGWPYQRLKDDIIDPGFDSMPVAGAVIPRFVAYDQHGQLVDLYDYALHGKPVVIDLSAGWCAPCREVAAWLEGATPNFGTTTEFTSIPGRVNAGEIYWITVLFEDAMATPADTSDASDWATAYPNPNVAVLADTDHQMFDYLWPGGYPSIHVLDDDMTMRVYDRFDYTSALQTLLQ